MLTSILSALQKPLYGLAAKLGLPKAAADVAVHALLVFVMAFAAQVSGAAIRGAQWPTVWALVVSAAAAGGSAVVHYVLGLIPAAAQKEPPPAPAAPVAQVPPAA